MYFIPTVLELSHTYVSVRVPNEINRLVMHLIRPPEVSGKDKGPVVDKRSPFRSPPIKRYLGGEGGCFFVCGDRRPHPGSLRVITCRRRPSFLFSSQREMKDERDRGM